MYINMNHENEIQDFQKKANDGYNSDHVSIITENKLQHTNGNSEGEPETDSVNDYVAVKDNKLCFLDYKFMKLYEMKRQAGFCHILTTIV